MVKKPIITDRDRWGICFDAGRQLELARKWSRAGDRFMADAYFNGYALDMMDIVTAGMFDPSTRYWSMEKYEKAYKLGRQSGRSAVLALFDNEDKEK